MKAFRLLLVSCAALLAAHVQAQDAASVNWTLIEADGVAVSATEGAAAGIDVRSSALVVRDYTGTTQSGGEGPLGPFQRWWLDGAEWPDDSAPVADRYVEFVVSAAPDGTFDVDSLSLVINAGGTGALRAFLAYDTDPAFANPTVLESEYSVPREEYAELGYAVDAALTDADSLYFRIYPWVRSSTTGSGRNLHLQDVTISGTSVGEPPPPPPPAPMGDYAYWSLTEADSVAVTAAEGGVIGVPVRSSTLEVRSYTGALADGSEGPLGPFQRWWIGGADWPVESGPDPARYVEFAATVEEGLIFSTDSVSFYLNAMGTGEMMASIFYDTDPAFASPAALTPVTGIPISRDELDFQSYPIDEDLAAGDSVFVRIFPWVGGGNAGSGRYILLQHAAIAGTTGEVPPEPVDGVFWSMTEEDSLSVTATGPNLGGASVRGEGIQVRNYAGGADPGDGPLGPFQRWWLGDGVDWPDEDALNPDRYIEFAAGAEPGFQFNVSSVSLYLQTHGTSNMMATLVHSTDPAFATADTIVADFTLPRETLTFSEFDVRTVVPEGDSLYFRIYPWLEGGGSPTKYVLLQAVTIDGEARVPPPPVEGVYWSLTEADSVFVTNTGEHLSGAPARGSEMVVRNYAGGADPGKGPLGPLQRWWTGTDWPDEDAPNPNRYIEFTAAAESGFAFVADSISLYLNTHGTSNMFASLYYSMREDFSEPVPIVEDYQLPRETLTFSVFDIDAIVPEGDSLYFRIYPYLSGGGSPTKYVLLQAMTIHGEAADPSVPNEADGSAVRRAALLPSYPNPTAGAARMGYELAEAGDVEVHVYNLLGQRVMTLVQEEKPAGRHEVAVDASALASGVYFVRMRAGDFAQTQKLVVTR